jgi:hypothetical protein
LLTETRESAPESAIGAVVASTMKSLLPAEGEPLGRARSRTTRTGQRPASFGSTIEPAIENDSAVGADGRSIRPVPRSRQPGLRRATTSRVRPALSAVSATVTIATLLSDGPVAGSAPHDVRVRAGRRRLGVGRSRSAGRRRRATNRGAGIGERLVGPRDAVTCSGTPDAASLLGRRPPARSRVRGPRRNRCLVVRQDRTVAASRGRTGH